MAIGPGSAVSLANVAGATGVATRLMAIRDGTPRLARRVRRGVHEHVAAAHALGFGAFWRTGPAAYDSEVKEALGFSASDSLIGFIYLGSIGKAGKVSPADLSGLARQW